MILTNSSLADPQARLQERQKAGYISDYYLQKNTTANHKSKEPKNFETAINSGTYQVKSNNSNSQNQPEEAYG